MVQVFLDDISSYVFNENRYNKHEKNGITVYTLKQDEEMYRQQPVCIILGATDEPHLLPRVMVRVWYDGYVDKEAYWFVV